MCEKFMMGVILGMIGGAYIVCNSNKARKMFKDGQQQIMQKVNEFKNSEQTQQEQQ